MHYLNLSFHGGECCGIKTIAGFGLYGGDTQPALKSEEASNPDRYGRSVTSSTNAFYKEAPSESTEERFKRYIEFCKEWRPQGCIEVALARSPYDSCDSWSQIKLWEPLLFEHGFKVTVPEFLNSNSGNYVQIYHLVYDATKEKPAAPAPAEPFERRL